MWYYHPVEGVGFLVNDEVGIASAAAVELVRRGHSVAALGRLAVNALVAEQPPVPWRVLDRVQRDDHRMHVRPAASVRTPCEGPMSESDLQAAMSSSSGQSCATCSPYVNEFVATKPIPGGVPPSGWVWRRPRRG